MFYLIHLLFPACWGLSSSAREYFDNNVSHKKTVMFENTQVADTGYNLVYDTMLHKDNFSLELIPAVIE